LYRSGPTAALSIASQKRFPHGRQSPTTYAACKTVSFTRYSAY